MHEYHRKDGDIVLERCATCGSPKAFSGYYWTLEKGIIVNGRTGRRMALLGYELLDSVFEALEHELGGTVPSVVVEAQRRFVMTGFYSVGDVGNEDDFRTELALRGLGNVRKVTMGLDGMHMRIDNISCHLMTIGMAQALFEMALEVKSDVEWELSKEDDLDVEVTPRKVRVTVAA